MGCSTPGFPVHHQLPELAQTHVHWVSDAIQPSHPLSSPSPSAFNPSQHQGLFKVSSSHQVANNKNISILRNIFIRSALKSFTTCITECGSLPFTDKIVVWMKPESSVLRNNLRLTILPDIKRYVCVSVIRKQQALFKGGLMVRLLQRMRNESCNFPRHCLYTYVVENIC